MQEETNTKAQIVSLLEGRRQEAIQAIHQFILDMDSLDYGEFLYPSDPDFVEDLNERDEEAKGMFENLKEIEETLRCLALGNIRVQ